MQKKTLIIINSSQVLMEISKKILERAGYIVHCAIGIAGAKEQLMDHTPDGIIVDSELPDGKGIDLCREMRETYDVPIIFLSANKEDELAALQAGASDFLKKPYNYDILKTRIGIVLNTKNGQPTINEDGFEFDATEAPAGSETAHAATQVQPNTAVIADTTKKVSGRKLFYSVAAAFIIVAIIGVTIYSVTLNDGGLRNFSDQDIPMAEFMMPDEDAVPNANNELFVRGGQGWLVPTFDKVTITADDPYVHMTLLNPEGNPYDFIFTITIRGKSEVIYTSGLVAPGTHIQSFRLDRALSKGEYNAELSICAYDRSIFSEISETSISFKLQAV